MVRGGGRSTEKTSTARTFRHEFREAGGYRVMLTVTRGARSANASLEFHVVPLRR